MEMKNSEWNVPSDYFERNKKALMPVRKMSNRNWLLTLAAACFVGIGLFMWKGKTETKEVAKVQVENQNEKQNENENEGKNEKEVNNEVKNEKGSEKGNEKGKEGWNKEEIAEGLKEISREELVSYLLEEDSELIENLN